MKILHIIDSLRVGGAERVLVDLCNILHERGVRVSVLVLTKSEELRPLIHRDIPYYNLDRKNKYNIRKLVQLSKLCSAADIIHVHMRHVLRYVLVCKLLLPFSSKTLLHDHFGDIEFNKGVDPLMRFCRSMYSHVGVSEALRVWAISTLGKKTSDCYVVANIVRKIVTPARLELPKGRVIVVSNFRRTKNIEFAIQVFSALRIFEGVKLDIYGHVADKSYFDEINQVIKSSHLDDRVALITNSSSIQTELSRYFFALHTSISETGPLALIEYLAYQVPFLAFKTGQVAEQLFSELPECFIETFCKETWVERVETILRSSSAEWKEKLGCLFDKHFSEDLYYQKWMDVYTRMLR